MALLDCAALLHSLLLFAQVVTINVAINSSNTSLLTLLVSNNFAELKVTNNNVEIGVYLGSEVR